MDQSSFLWRIQAACESLKNLPKLRSAHTLEDFYKWTQVADHFLEGYALSDDTKMHALLTRMDSTMQHLVHVSVAHTWTEAKKMLEKHYRILAKQEDTEHYLSVVDMIQENDESLDSFALRLRKVAANSWKQNGVALPNWVIREVFCNNVTNDAVRQHLRQVRPPTLDAAVDQANAKTAELYCNIQLSVGDMSTEAGSTISGGEDPENLSPPEFVTLKTPTRRVVTPRSIDEKVLAEVMSVIKLSRKNRTVHDYKRYCQLNQPGLTAEQKRLIIETPSEAPSINRLLLELNVMVLPFCTFKFGRPLAVYNIRLPRLGRFISSLNNGKPILTPGKWIANLESLVAKIPKRGENTLVKSAA